MGNDLQGHAINNDWDYTWFWPTFRFHSVKFVGGGVTEPIPGFPVGVVLTATIIAFLGIVYTIRRKKKFM